MVVVVERGGCPSYTITLRAGSAERGREEKKIKAGRINKTWAEN